MKKIILVFGLIAGVIVSILMLANMSLLENGTINFDNGEYFGYAGMVIALSETRVGMDFLFLMISFVE